MKKLWPAIVAALMLAAGACSLAPAPVPVLGAPADLRHLAGDWGGDYQGSATGRSGSIVFHLTASSDTASGDVVMIPRQARGPGAGQAPAMGIPVPRTGEVLSIAFVRASGDTVSGRLRPYHDPECDCMLNTTFEGRIHGDVIEGRYTSMRAEGGPTQTGTWKVKRKKP
jgi:hypothetical protein